MIESHGQPALIAPKQSRTSWMSGVLGGSMVRTPSLVLLFSALTAVGAYVTVPLGFTPIPMTLQTLFVLLSGAVLGPVGGAASQLLYLGLGVAGVPVFAGGGAGFAWVFGPTGGYLMGFPAAAALVGLIGGQERGLVRNALALIVGTTVIFILGMSWLLVVTDQSASQLFAVAVQPFLPGAVLKIAIALIVVHQLRTRGFKN